ncbi:hypothetical protein GCM10022244_22830 [Streptomyces gulbargensis]|uniref:Uncharacterized protein n=1 Tax=Streptomyces gulbargensis TaxID=364901 RepID=A0ABP7M5I1_9ACTN
MADAGEAIPTCAVIAAATRLVATNSRPNLTDLMLCLSLQSHVDQAHENHDRRAAARLPVIFVLNVSLDVGEHSQWTHTPNKRLTDKKLSEEVMYLSNPARSHRQV